MSFWLPRSWHRASCEELLLREIYREIIQICTNRLHALACNNPSSRSRRFSLCYWAYPWQTPKLRYDVQTRAGWKLLSNILWCFRESYGCCASANDQILRVGRIYVQNCQRTLPLRVIVSLFQSNLAKMFDQSDTEVFRLSLKGLPK